MKFYSKQGQDYKYNALVKKALNEWQRATKGRVSFTVVNTLLESNVNIDWKRVERVALGHCYFSFDNTKYAALIRAAEIKRANSHNRSRSIDADIAEINSILQEYDSNATLNKQKEVLKRAITKASVTVSEGAEDIDKPAVQFNFVTTLIENLIQAIIYSIFSPKVLMLLEVNETLMGGTWKKFSQKDLLQAMRSIITAVIKEVKDLILQELLKLLEKA
jgi:hypothetical protein